MSEKTTGHGDRARQRKGYSWGGGKERGNKRNGDDRAEQRREEEGGRGRKRGKPGHVP
jgi:hypothetical protein